MYRTTLSKTNKKETKVKALRGEGVPGGAETGRVRPWAAQLYYWRMTFDPENIEIRKKGSSVVSQLKASDPVGLAQG